MRNRWYATVFRSNKTFIITLYSSPSCSDVEAGVSLECGRANSPIGLGDVTLSWPAVAAADLAGYFVERIVENGKSSAFFTLPHQVIYKPGNQFIIKLRIGC